MKTKLLSTGLVTIIGLYLLSCSSKELITPESESQTLFVINSNISEFTAQQQNEAIKKAYQFLEVINNDPTKTKANINKKSIHSFTIVPTSVKASLKKTSDFISLSIVQLLSDKGTKDGFMILANDGRIYFPLAFADEGTCDLSKNQSLLNYVTNDLDSYITHQNNSKQVLTKSYSARCEYELIDRQWVDEEASCFTGVTWAQDLLTYQDKLDRIICSGNEKYPPAGCIAVALGHIMAYHQWPQSGQYMQKNGTLHNTVYDWQRIKAHPKASYLKYSPFYDYVAASQVGDLMAEIGYKAGLTYGCDGTRGVIQDAMRALSAMGYRNHTIVTGDPISIIKSNINAKKPIYMEGLKSSTTGHAWSVEAYKYSSCTEIFKKITPCDEYFDDEEPNYVTTYHEIGYIWCNWGEEGSANAYCSVSSSYYHYSPQYNLPGIPNPIYNQGIKMIVNITK